MAVAWGLGCRAGHSKKPQSAARGTCRAVDAVCRLGWGEGSAASSGIWRGGRGPGLPLGPGLLSRCRGRPSP